MERVIPVLAVVGLHRDRRKRLGFAERDSQLVQLTGDVAHASLRCRSISMPAWIAVRMAKLADSIRNETCPGGG